MKSKMKVSAAALLAAMVLLFLGYELGYRAVKFSPVVGLEYSGFVVPSVPSAGRKWRM